MAASQMVRPIVDGGTQFQWGDAPILCMPQLVATREDRMKHSITRWGLVISVLTVGAVLLIAGQGRLRRSAGDVPASAREVADPGWFEYVTAPMVPECAEELAKFSAEVPQLNDLAVQIDHVSVRSGEARVRFGMNTDVKGSVEFMLLDVWPRHTLDRINPTNPAPPGTPSPPYQQVSAVLVEPSGAVRVRHTEPLSGTRKRASTGLTACRSPGIGTSLFDRGVKAAAAQRSAVFPALARSGPRCRNEGEAEGGCQRRTSGLYFEPSHPLCANNG
jgi:hypothetical protein